MTDTRVCDYDVLESGVADSKARGSCAISRNSN